MSDVEIRMLGPDEVARYLSVLVGLHRGMINDQAARGFGRDMVPESRHYWRALAGELRAGSRVLLGAFVGRRLVGAALLGLPDRTNARHRGEVQQLMVAPGVRGQGVGRALLAAMHEEILRRERSLVVFHTRCGDPSAGFFRAAGYRETAGSVGLFGAGSEALTLHHDLGSIAGALTPRRDAPPPE